MDSLETVRLIGPPFRFFLSLLRPSILKRVEEDRAKDIFGHEAASSSSTVLTPSPLRCHRLEHPPSLPPPPSPPVFAIPSFPSRQTSLLPTEPSSSAQGSTSLPTLGPSPMAPPIAPPPRATRSRTSNAVVALPESRPWVDHGLVRDARGLTWCRGRRWGKRCHAMRDAKAKGDKERGKRQRSTEKEREETRRRRRRRPTHRKPQTLS